MTSYTWSRLRENVTPLNPWEEPENLGLTKNFRVRDRVRIQVKVEALNATNYTLFGAGNMVLATNDASFMKLSNIDSSTVMKPRDIQLGLRVTF